MKKKKSKAKSLSEKRKQSGKPFVGEVPSKFGEWKTTTFGSGKGIETYWSLPKQKPKKRN